MTAAHRPEFDALAERVHDVLAGRPAIFMINPGNWGDSMIREGAESFLRYYDISYHSVRFKDVLKNRTSLDAERAATHHSDPVLIYNGCGAFSPHYEMAARVANLTRQFSTSIILPSTFAIDVAEYKFSDTTHFFVRDRFESAERMPGSPFCHDMAFFLDPVARPPVRDIGYMLRDDAETPEGTKFPPGNVDLSRNGRAHTPVDGFLEAIGQFREIHTNRLHIAIASVLLGRRTHLSSNDYFKIRAIFDSSIRDYFDAATFEPAPDIE
ncbi:MAG: hypothetical protein AAGA12_07160 [Pseudomonadota bacterium]